MDNRPTDELAYKPIPVTDVDMAFGGAGGLFDKLMPKWEDVPEEIRHNWIWKEGWQGYANKWFFEGLDTKGFTPKPGIDAETAWRHIGTIMRSFRPKHEHKIASAAYLMSLWFDLPKKNTA